MTCTVIVQVPTGVGGIALAGIVPPVRVTVRGAVTETVPPQVVDSEPLTIVIFVLGVEGRVSVMFTPVYAEFVGFCNVIVRVLMPPA